MRNKRAGFTLIELMIALVIASIGILAVSWILTLTQSSWKEGNEKLQLQRDAHLAILRIEHELKPASSSTVSTSDSTLYIDKNNGRKFFLDEDGDLLFQESSSASAELVVEGDAGTEFHPGISNAVVSISFTLVRGDLEGFITTSVKPRN